MTLFDALRYWWACRRLRTMGTFGDYIVIPPNAIDVRIIRHEPSDGFDYDTVGVKWKVKV